MRKVLALLCLGAIACGPSPTPTSSPANPVGQPGATVRTPIRAVQRPDVTKSFPLDYATVPYLVATPLSPAESSAGISMLRTSSGAEQAHVGNDLLAEIELGSVRAFTSDPLVEPAQGKGDSPVDSCVSRPGTSPVSWEGFALGTWSDRAIDYVRFEGTYDFETCKAKPTRVARVRAPALIPGVAYAFRTCVPVCSVAPATPGTEELLVIIGPPARWVGASVPWPKMQTEPHVGLFSRIIVPLKKGGSASAFFHVSETDLNAFLARRRNKAPVPPDIPKAPLVQMSFDFSWAESDPQPVGVGFVGLVSTEPPPQSELEIQRETVAQH